MIFYCILLDVNNKLILLVQMYEKLNIISLRFDLHFIFGSIGPNTKCIWCLSIILKELGIILTTREEGETSAIDQKLLKSRSIRLIITIKEQNKETKTKTTIIGDKLLESDRHSSLSECFDVIHLSREWLCAVLCLTRPMLSYCMVDHGITLYGEWSRQWSDPHHGEGNKRWPMMQMRER